MIQVFKQLWKTLGGGTLGLLGVVLGLGVANLAARMLGWVNLAEWLAMDPSAFWHGWLWVLVTHAFLPAGPWDIILNGMMLLMLGAWIERSWSKTELWLYALLVAAGTGAAKLLLHPVDASMIYGTLPLSIGLLAALSRLFGPERILFMGVIEMTIRQFALCVLVIDTILMLTTCGMTLTSALAVLAAWPAGWFYLTLRWNYIKSGAAQKVESSRTRRLEL
jgi:membrane associated rhomboid family serine protease